MTRSAQIAALLAATLTLALTAQANAGGCGKKTWKPPIHPPILPPPVVCEKPPIILPPPVICHKPPVVLPPPVVCKPHCTCHKCVTPPVICHRPPICTKWYFGMSVQLINTHYGPGVQVFSVQPGSPAQLAGLEPGDVIFNSNGTPLVGARTNQHAVQLIQSTVSLSNPVAGNPISGGPVQTFTLASTGVQTLVAPPTAQQLGIALLTVLDVRTGSITQLTVYPTSLSGTPAPTLVPTIPAPATPLQASPANPAPTAMLTR